MNIQHEKDSAFILLPGRVISGEIIPGISS
jgi:hypothetical protein